jgi:hypothetical protein
MAQPLIYLVYKHQDPVNARRMAELTEKDHLELLQIIDDSYQETRHFAKEWVAGQDAWKPLSPAYVKDKERDGFSTKIWVREGNTIDALSHKATITGKVSSVGERREIHVTRMGGGVIEAVWKILAPAAGGKFYKVNLFRNWIFRRRADTEAVAYRKLAEWVARYYARILGNK